MNDSTLEKKIPLTEEQANVVDIFKRQAVTAAASLHIPENKAVGITEYQACEEERGGSSKPEWIDIYPKDEDSFSVPYHLMLRMNLSKSCQHLSIICSDSVLNLTGRHLHEVRASIRRRKICILRCFDPTQHTMPPETEILITNIFELTIKEFEAG